MKRAAIIFGAFIASVILAVILTSVVATQINLATIQSFGLEVSFGQRLENTLFDVAGIFPLLAVVIAVCFLLGFLVAALLVKLTSVNRSLLYGLAGGTSFLTFVYVIWYLLGAIPLEGAATVGGRLLLAFCCAMGGLLFAQLSAAKTDSGSAV